MKAYLACEETLGETGEHGRAIVVLAIQRFVLLFRPLPVEHVVAALFGDGGDEVKLVCDVDRLLDFARTPFRSAPVEGPALFDHPVERADDLFHRNYDSARYRSIKNMNACDKDKLTGRVWAMRKDYVDVVQLKTFQGFLCAFDNAV